MVYQYDQIVQVTVSIPASAPALTKLTASITVDPTTGVSQSTVTIPSSQQWTITDAYQRGSSDTPVDAQVYFVKNAVKTLLISPPLSALLISNPSRPRIRPMLYENNSRLSINVVTLVANGTTAATDTFFLQVSIVDSTFG